MKKVAYINIRLTRRLSMNKKTKQTLLVSISSIIICGILFFIVNIKESKAFIKSYISKSLLFYTENIYESNYPLYSYFFQSQEKVPFYIEIVDSFIPIVNYVTEVEKEVSWYENTSMSQEIVDKLEEKNSNLQESQVADNTNSTSNQGSGEENQTTNSVDNHGEEQIIPSSEGVDNVSNEVKEVSLLPIQSSIIPKIQNLPTIGGFTLEQMQDFEFLKKNLYVVDSKTSITENELNPKKLLAKDLTIKGDNTTPQILIYHTHSQEAYADSVSGDVEDTIVGVGNYLTNILTEQYGYHVMHHTGIYDMTDGKLDRDPAYNKALPELEKILQENPTIEIVIDLHRDGVNENVHLVQEVNGKQTARLMFFNGICRDTNGEIEGLENPYREDNLAFSLQMALTTKSYYPGLLRVVYLNKNRYNQHIASRCALVEVGAQTNTVEEAMNAMPILADIIHKVVGK